MDIVGKHRYYKDLQKVGRSVDSRFTIRYTTSIWIWIHIKAQHSTSTLVLMNKMNNPCFKHNLIVSVIANDMISYDMIWFYCDESERVSMKILVCTETMTEIIYELYKALRSLHFVKFFCLHQCLHGRSFTNDQCIPTFTMFGDGMLESRQIKQL